VRRRRVEITEQSAPKPQKQPLVPPHIEAASFRMVSGKAISIKKVVERICRALPLPWIVLPWVHTSNTCDFDGSRSLPLLRGKQHASGSTTGGSVGTARTPAHLSAILNQHTFLDFFPWKTCAFSVTSSGACRETDRSDWHRRYAYRHCAGFRWIGRYTGACYRAANWLLVGYTKGPRQTGSRVQSPLSKKATSSPTDKRCNEHLRA